MNLDRHDFVHRIKKKRGDQERKTIQTSLFERILVLVKQYKLSAEFLDHLKRFAKGEIPENVSLISRPYKDRLVVPPFEMAEEREYMLTVGIIENANNPYLEHVSSPEEIFYSVLLYRFNPNLSPDLLRRNHYGKLLKQVLGAKTGE